jgi:hypothetical protein
MDSRKPAFERTVGRVLVASVALGSLAMLLDAGAKYSGTPWRPAYARERSALELEVSAPGFTPLEFRLAGNLPLGGGQKTCAVAAGSESASQNGDEAFDINCTGGGATVKAVGELPHWELLSWPGGWMYHRALRF